MAAIKRTVIITASSPLLVVFWTSSDGSVQISRENGRLTADHDNDRLPLGYEEAEWPSGSHSDIS